MNSIKLLSTSLVVATLIFTGCGSSSNNNATTPTINTGTFVDAPVKGLSYKTASQSGLTDSNGNFKYIAGETIEFKLGDLSLGSVTAGSLITPYTLGDSDISNPSDKTTNIALLLQNFDGDRSDKSTLDVSKLKAYTFTNEFNLSAKPDSIKAKLDTLFADNNFAQYRDAKTSTILNASTVNSTMKKFVTTEMQSNEVSVKNGFGAKWLNGKTIYAIYNFEDGTYLVKETFTSNKHTFSYYIDGAFSTTGENHGTEPYTIENGKIHISFVDEEGGYTHEILATDNDKITVKTLEDGEERTDYFYFDEAKAKVEMQSNEVTVENGFGAKWLNGKTMWSVSEDNGSNQLIELTFTDKNLRITNREGISNYTYNLDEDGIIHWLDDGDKQQMNVVSIGKNIIYVPEETDPDEGIDQSETSALYLEKADAQKHL